MKCKHCVKGKKYKFFDMPGSKDLAIPSDLHVICGSYKKVTCDCCNGRYWECEFCNDTYNDQEKPV